MGLPQKPFSPEHKAQLIEGDKDLFGDGSVVLVSTPGHTPGHQSLLVKLPKAGAVLLTGDAVHFKDNWDNRRVPAFNADKDQTIAAMQRIADFLAKEQAKLWINHDKPSSDARRHAPEFYEEWGACQIGPAAATSHNMCPHVHASHRYASRPSNPIPSHAAPS